MVVALHLFQQAQALQLGYDGLPGFKPLHPGKAAGRLGHVAVLPDYRDYGQAVTLADFEVGHIVAGSHLQGPGAELGFNRRISDDGDSPIHDG